LRCIREVRRPGGVITVECAYPHLVRFLAPLIARFHADRPGVEVAIHGLSVLPLIKGVTGGDVDDTPDFYLDQAPRW
jgi:DNA-binding transcriptional LysR family regulator